MKLISYYIYYPFYFLLKTFLGPYSDKVFARHSFYFKKIKFGISDIDFTLYSKSSILIKTKGLNKLLPFVKKMIPILGEINYVDDKGIESLKAYINPVELRRDPELKLLIDEDKTPSIIQKEVFLLRIFSSDVKNMKKGLHKRIKKISYCISLLEPLEEVGPSDLKSVGHFIEYLKAKALKSNDSIVYDYLLDLFQEENSVQNSERLALVKDCLNKTWEKILEQDEWKEVDKNLVIEFLKWELWGIYTQIPTYRDYKALLTHVVIVSELLSKLTTEYDSCSNYLVDQISELA
jgi:hypothetical protein